MNTKPWWQSKTLWFNAVTLAVAVAGGAVGVPIPPSVAAPVIGVGNIALRLLTNQGLSAT